MSKRGLVDPLDAAKELCDAIAARPDDLGRVDVLARSIDKFMFALRWAFEDDVPSIQNSDLEPPTQNHDRIRALIAKRFPELGQYWVALDCRDQNQGELAKGDAIDDLADIHGDLQVALWFRDNASHEDGLAALRFAYHAHLRMHVLPLRGYLEEIVFEGPAA